MKFDNKPILGMIHLAGSGAEEKIGRAFKEIGILMNEGVDGVIIENYHGSVNEVVKVLEFIQGLNFPERGMHVGVNILPNDYKQAFMLADDYGANFIQLDYISGKYENNKTVDIEHYKTFREKYSHIKVLGGVWPKYYTPIKGSVLKDDIQEAMSLVDAVVVTGVGTGHETDIYKVMLFKEILQNFPLIVGAGLTPSNVVKQLEIADGGIVGSCFKPYSRTNEMVSKELVKEFMNEVRKVRNGFERD